MTTIAVFSGDFCRGSSVVRELIDRTGLRLITDSDLVARAVELSGLEERKFERLFSTRVSVFNAYTHEKERCLAWLRLALSELLAGPDLLLSGFLTHLVPGKLGSVLKVCLIGNTKYRLAVAAEEQGLSERDAAAAIARLDGERSLWTLTTCEQKDPWEVALYDIVVPLDKMSTHEAAVLIEKQWRQCEMLVGDTPPQSLADFRLASEVEVALVGAGHAVDVSASSGQVELTINKKVLFLGRLEEQLKDIARQVPGVESVQTRTGKGFHQPDIYRQCDMEAPTRVLLVDDEREFVQTLSERLSLRDIGSAVAFDGESALKLVHDDEPEVMILDLKMPGVDGMEVLRQVKNTRPEVEVIILTGHGSEEDRRKCMELGAFAYLHKPVDIDVLSRELRAANDKIHQSAGAAGGR
ncbi:MAG: response regulator [Desulfobulbaceae bacterium A2]|nr:MAG: response regulator [Desulfobulbaceae bacterium A2]